jgi:hypothetical protein
MLGESGGGPGDIVSFMLGGARTEVENGSPEKRANNGLLKWSDDAGVDRGVHKSIFDGVEAFSEDVVVSSEAHIVRYGGRRLIRQSSG